MIPLRGCAKMILVVLALLTTQLQKLSPNLLAFLRQCTIQLRNNDTPNLHIIDDATGAAFANFAGVSYDSRNPLSADAKKLRVLQEDWIRNNDPSVGNNPEFAVVAFSKVTGLPMLGKFLAKNKKNFVNESVGWLRNNDPGRLETVDDGTTAVFAKLAGIPYDGYHKSYNNERRKALEDAINWIRNNDSDAGADPDNEVVLAMSKIAGFIPKVITPEKKKSFVDDAVDWLRNNDPSRLETVDDATAEAIMKLAGLSGGP